MLTGQTCSAVCEDCNLHLPYHINCLIQSWWQSIALYALRHSMRKGINCLSFSSLWRFFPLISSICALIMITLGVLLHFFHPPNHSFPRLYIVAGNDLNSKAKAAHLGCQLVVCNRRRQTWTLNPIFKKRKDTTYSIFQTGGAPKGTIMPRHTHGTIACWVGEIKKGAYRPTTRLSNYMSFHTAWLCSQQKPNDLFHESSSPLHNTKNSVENAFHRHQHHVCSSDFLLFFARHYGNRRTLSLQKFEASRDGQQ